MQEILKKIDEERTKHQTLVATCKEELNSMYHLGVGDGLNKAKEIILAEQPKPLTVGDKIRESNESLAEFIKHYDAQYIDDYYCRNLCEHRVDGHCNISECDRSNYNGISEYLNQPNNQSIR